MGIARLFFEARGANCEQLCQRLSSPIIIMPLQYPLHPMHRERDPLCIEKSAGLEIFDKITLTASSRSGVYTKEREEAAAKRRQRCQSDDLTVTGGTGDLWPGSTSWTPAELISSMEPWVTVTDGCEGRRDEDVIEMTLSDDQSTTKWIDNSEFVILPDFLIIEMAKSIVEEAIEVATAAMKATKLTDSQHVCPVCYKSRSSAWNLRRHMASH